MPQSPEEFARKLGRVAQAVKTQESRAIGARALVTKRFIVAAATSRNRGAKARWVSYQVRGDTARLQLRGGIAHLTERGSYKHPTGWGETPRASTHRRRKAAAKRGQSFSAAKALRTPWGPRASVRHPALRARPFWQKGIAASRAPGRKAYEKVINHTITSAMR